LEREPAARFSLLRCARPTAFAFGHHRHSGQA